MIKYGNDRVLIEDKENMIKYGNTEQSHHQPTHAHSLLFYNSSRILKMVVFQNLSSKIQGSILRFTITKKKNVQNQHEAVSLKYIFLQK